MMEASDILDREFLETRARILTVAATLDRMARAEGSVEEDSRYQDLLKSLALLAQGNAGSLAEEVQKIFSLSDD